MIWVGYLMSLETPENHLKLAISDFDILSTSRTTKIHGLKVSRKMIWVREVEEVRLQGVWLLLLLWHKVQKGVEKFIFTVF